MVWHTKKKAGRYDSADRAFSKLVRFGNVTHQGYIRCYTCGKIDTPDQMDAGHYVGRSVIALRFNPKNVKSQCRSCNRFKEGAKDEYALALIKEYGEGILEELNKEKYTTRNYSDIELKDMAKGFRQELKKINI